jgi:NitT/TauT family transport system substrate-binding protein
MFRYVSAPFDTVYQSFMREEFDFITDFAPLLVYAIDQGMAVTVLAGVHAGCFELFVNNDIRSIADLRGKTIGVAALNSPQHMFLAPIAAQVGIDPSKDIKWVVSPSVKPMQLFIDGKLDGFPSHKSCTRAGSVI